MLTLFAAYCSWVIGASDDGSTLASRESIGQSTAGRKIGVLLALTALFAVLSTGVIRSWRWTFWLILVVFLAGILRVPASALQIAGILPGQDPAWYVVLQAVVGLIQFVIALAMLAGFGGPAFGAHFQVALRYRIRVPCLNTEVFCATKLHASHATQQRRCDSRLGSRCRSCGGLR